MTPEQRRERAQRRAGMSQEERQTEALETIADLLSAINGHLASSTHHLAGIARKG